MKVKCHSKSIVLFASAGVAAGTLMLAGCSTPIQGRKVSPSGFLDDYSMLTAGKGGQAKLVFINPSAEFSKYNKIIIEPVVVCASEKSPLLKLSKKERQELVDYLDATVRKNLTENYRFVTLPGPDVMRLRIAITDGEKARVLLNTASSVVPISLAVDVLRFAATGKHSSVGEASIEMELIDTVSGTRLFAAVDDRAGRKSVVSGNFTRWGDVKDAFDYWARRLNDRLAKQRSQK